MSLRIAVFSTIQIAKLSGNTYRRTQKLIDYGLLVPAIDVDGRHRMFSMFALFEATRLGLLMNAGLDVPQLRASSKVIHDRILATVKPEPGFDLVARAGYGFLIETVKALQQLNALGDDTHINAFIREATKRLNSKPHWRIETLAAQATAPAKDVKIKIPPVFMRQQITSVHDKSRVSALV